MKNLVIAALIFILATPAFAGNHCYVKPEPVKIVEVKIPAQKIEQTIQNNIEVTNNLIMPPPVSPLIIPEPFPAPELLQRRFFSFRNNMPAPQLVQEPVRSAFTGLANNKITPAFIINNVVSRTTTTTTKSGVTTTTSNVKATPSQSSNLLITPNSKSGK